MRRGQANFVFLCISLCFGTAHPAEAGEDRFDPAADTFAFANETVFAHPNQPPSAEVGTSDLETNIDSKYSRRCFVLTRAALQFHRHAQFDPEAPRLPNQEYRQRVRQLARRPAWRAPCRDESPIVIPGFANLHQFSHAHARMLQDELGGGLPTYFRLANWRMVFPFSTAALRATAERLARRVASGQPTAVYLTQWTEINHAVLVYGVTRGLEGGYRFHFYDPNLPAARQVLRFDGDSFQLPESFYFAGGKVGIYLIYTHALD